ncbi:unnamed protein product, partial [Discosporangium mesarthrocarpum]
LELVYTDLQGPLQPSSQNYSYIAMFMDDLTKIKKQYFLQVKSGALDSLYNFVRDIAIPEGLHVGRLRSDNGGEYTEKAFRDYCKTVGIKQEFTAPYTPQHHAPIERKWGTLMAVTRCLLQESGLPSVLWPEAFATTTYIGNLVPTSGLAGGTPYAAWFGSPASLAHLRV